MAQTQLSLLAQINMLEPTMNLRLPLSILVLLICCVQRPLDAEDWPQFLGPNRNGISDEEGLIEVWPEGGLKVLWRAPGGLGMSAVVVAQGKAITMTQARGSQLVVCNNAKTGRPLWASNIAPAYENAQGNGPRATPVVVDDYVFVHTGDGILAALSLESGLVKWKRSALTALKLKESDYGTASSPLVVGGKVIVMVGGNPGSLAAFSALDGQLVWSEGGRDTAGYSSPVHLNLAGRDQVVTFTGSSVLAVDPKSGKRLWRYPFATDFDCNIATPVAVGKDQLLISSGENHGAVMLKLTSDGDEMEAEEVWTSLGRKSTLRSAWQTGIVDGNVLYGFDNVGAAGPVMHYTCIDLKSGKQLWVKERFGKGNHSSADGKLFITTMKGELVVVAKDPKGYRELGRMQVLGQTRQAPAISDGRLYLRDNKEIVCLDAKRP
jgi:outer membrane protein assembly factor BamB